MIPIAIDGDRLLRELRELAQMGRDQRGGVSRLAFTAVDLEGRAWFMDRARSAGLDVTVDPVGNILALEPSTGEPVLSGSHLDSVPQGGSFDGALGVLAALEAVRSIRARNDLGSRRPLGVLVLAAEESSRFGTGCLGSRVIVGDLTTEDLRDLTDVDGCTVLNALREAGLQPERLEDAARKPGWFHEFVEIHVDQAEDLYEAGVPLGVITGIAAPSRLWLQIRGQQAHSGATLMHKRRDALVGAALVVQAVESAATCLVGLPRRPASSADRQTGRQAGRQVRQAARADHHIVGTVGVLRVHPGSMNMVPGYVEVGVDIRGTDRTLIQETVDEVCAETRAIADRRGLEVNIRVLQRGEPVIIAEERCTSLERACAAAGAAHTSMVSRSAHDAMFLARHGPVGMLFVRNPAGVSHNPAEAVWDEDVVLATSALATYMADAATANVHS